ncbi:MAG: cyclophilin-like fold protein [Candidatus Sericytochromatia bacterium]
MHIHKLLFPHRMYQDRLSTAFRLSALTVVVVLSLGCTSQSSRKNTESTPVQAEPAPPSSHSPSTAPNVQASATPQASSESETRKNMINITVNNRVFEATLSDNPTVQRFINKLPLTLDMQDLHSNEKFYYFQESFPTAAQSIGRIQAGDLMLYGDNCLVLFYQSFTTRYPYTRMGRIPQISGLSEALGSGNAKITFSKK